MTRLTRAQTMRLDLLALQVGMVGRNKFGVGPRTGLLEIIGSSPNESVLIEIGKSAASHQRAALGHSRLFGLALGVSGLLSTPDTFQWNL